MRHSRYLEAHSLSSLGEGKVGDNKLSGLSQTNDNNVLTPPSLSASVNEHNE